MGLGVVWLDVPLGAACLLAGLHHLRLALGRRAPVVSASGYAVMGFGMAAMFVPTADPVPRAAWIVVFTGSALWFAVAAVRSRAFGDAGHHVVGAVAMLFMLLGPGHGTGSGLFGPVVALALAAWFLAEVVRLLAHHPAPVAVPAGAARGKPAPASRAEPPRGGPAACLVMNAAMALMLVVMA